MKKITKTAMKKFGKLLKMNNAVDPAAPAFVWGKGVPGKPGATTNYDPELSIYESRVKCYGKAVAANA